MTRFLVLGATALSLGCSSCDTGGEQVLAEIRFASDRTAFENAANATFNFEIILDAASTEEVRVDYATVALTATGIESLTVGLKSFRIQVPGPQRKELLQIVQTVAVPSCSLPHCDCWQQAYHRLGLCRIRDGTARRQIRLVCRHDSHTGPTSRQRQHQVAECPRHHIQGAPQCLVAYGPCPRAQTP